MRSTFFGIELMRRAMAASQRAMDVTGHNVANAETPGYSRQRVRLETTTPHTLAGVFRPQVAGQLGTGVQVVAIERVRDRFLDDQLRATNGWLGRWEAREEMLGQVEAVLQEPSELGLSGYMDRFFAAWQALSTTPEDMGARTAAIQESEALAQAFVMTRERIQAVREDAVTALRSDLSKINDLADAIVELNIEIARAVVVGDAPNDLLDKRDLLLDELSKLADISVGNANTGMINVTIGGRAIVLGNEARHLDLTIDPTTLDVSLNWGDGSPVNVRTGRIVGLISIINDTVPLYLDTLDELAKSIITEVNAVHASAYDLNGNPAGPFFTGSSAADIAVRADIAEDPRLLGTSASPEATGDGSKAVEVAQLKDKLSMHSGVSTFGDFYSEFVSKVGLDSRAAKRAKEVYENVLESQEDRRDSISGVSMDEELMNMLKYQASYEAAARMITAVDEMLDRLINGTGVVGR